VTELVQGFGELLLDNRQHLLQAGGDLVDRALLQARKDVVRADHDRDQRDMTAMRGEERERRAELRSLVRRVGVPGAVRVAADITVDHRGRGLTWAAQLVHAQVRLALPQHRVELVGESLTGGDGRPRRVRLGAGRQ
jgi:hypothetical protein